jgi:hypothetical protein
MFGIQGNLFASLALLGYIPFTFVLFALLPSRKAVIFNFIIAWLFLPMSELIMPGMMALNKMSLACVGTMIGTCIFDADVLLAFRPKVWDIPMAVLCLVPYLSARSNGYPAYTGIAAIAYQTLDWGFPYFIGRLYFTDLKAMRELAAGIVIGGILYVPLCWYEIRMSPQLHAMVYGYTPSDFSNTKRYGSYRPIVFMQTGLSVAMWLASAAVTAFWLWYSGAKSKILGMRTGWIALALALSEFGLRSFGAAALMMIGIGVLLLTKYTKLKLWLILLILIPPFWITTRTLDIWTGQDLEDLVRQVAIGRADSLHTRLVNERKLVDRALLQPYFGWTGAKYNIGRNPKEQLGIPDMMWVIIFGQSGVFALTAMVVSMLLPLSLLMWRIPIRYWHLASAAPAAALAMLVTMHMCDMLFNAMVNPIFLLAAGGVTGMAFCLRDTQQTTRPTYMHPHQQALPLQHGTAIM